MSDFDYPPHMVCPITQDVMNKPVSITIDGHEYTYEKVAIDAWMTTPNGDKNPVTMETLPDSGVLFTPNQKLKNELDDFLKSNGLCDLEPPSKPEIEPFSDFQQIQDDETVAMNLHRELNVMPPVDRFHWLHPRIVQGLRTRTLDQQREYLLPYNTPDTEELRSIPNRRDPQIIRWRDSPRFTSSLGFESLIASQGNIRDLGSMHLIGLTRQTLYYDYELPLLQDIPVLEDIENQSMRDDIYDVALNIPVEPDDEIPALEEVDNYAWGDINGGLGTPMHEIMFRILDQMSNITPYEEVDRYVDVRAPTAEDV